MNQQVATTNTRSPKQLIQYYREQLDSKMGEQIRHALPAHIPHERFNRVVMTAIQQNPKLLACNPQSVFNACLRAAQDGLLPDGREGAIVPFGENVDGRKAADQAQWMPMIYGIRKKIRNSGEITDLYAHVVRQGDDFDIELGDDLHLKHKPQLDGGENRKIIGAYSVAVLKDGLRTFEWMSVAEIETIRKKFSRSSKGPWNDEATYGEMCRKTVVRRHAKTLPSSSDLDHLMHRDDELYAMKEAGERGKRQPTTNAMDALQQFGKGQPQPDDDDQDQADPRQGDQTVIDEDGVVLDESEDTGPPTVADMFDSLKLLYKNPPTTAEAFDHVMTTLIEMARQVGPEGAQFMTDWWVHERARAMRTRAGVPVAEAAKIAEQIKALTAELNGQAQPTQQGQQAQA